MTPPGRPALLALFLFLAFPLPVQAHRVNIFAWIEGDRVVAQATFSSGRPVRDARVEVFADPGDRLLLEGSTSEQGLFSFPIPKDAVAGKSGLRLVLNADMGHRDEWSIPPEDFKTDPAPGAATSASTAVAPPAGPRRGQGAAPLSAATSGSGAAPQAAETDQQELLRSIEALLDSRLAPLERRLAENSETGPRFVDIVGGLGYIVGLVGIALWLCSVRKPRGR